MLKSTKYLIQIVNCILAILTTGFLVSMAITIGFIAQKIDLQWIQNSYFAKIVNFDWLKFISQSFLLLVIFCLIYASITYSIYINGISTPAFIKKNFVKITTFYFSLALTITFSITMPEDTFTTTTAIVALFGLIYPFAVKFSQQITESNEYNSAPNRTNDKEKNY